MSESGGIPKLVSRIEEGEFYTKAQVAEIVGRDVSTIKRWQKKNPSLRPTHHMNLDDEGKNFVWLYTPEDVARYKQFSSTIKIGRPRKNGGS